MVRARDAAALLNRHRAASQGQPVTYTRGALSVTLTVTTGQTDHPTVDEAGQLLTFTSVDFLATAADLILDGETTEPAPGDRITTAAGHTYEILPTADGAPFRYSDAPANTILRIHTKRVNGGI